MSRKTEMQVGLTVIVALAILIGSMAWLKEFSLHAAKRTWKVDFPQTGGLAASDEVLVNGIRKGQVRSMKLAGDRVMVELDLDREITLTHDSKVSIRNVGLMGEKVIAVDLRSTGSRYRESDVILGNYEKGLGEVLGEMGQTIDAVATLSEQLRALTLSLNVDGKLVSTVQNFNRTSEELRLAVSENRATLKVILSNFEAASKTARRLTTDREESLRRAMDDFGSAAGHLDRLAGRLDSLRASIQLLTGKVERGEGTLGKLVNDEKLYGDLNESVRSLKNLVEDVKAHPKKYLKFSIF